MNEIWKDVFFSWQKICKQQFHLENVEKELYRMPIWYNSQIKVKKVYSSKSGTKKELKLLVIF